MILCYLIFTKGETGSSTIAIMKQLIIINFHVEIIFASHIFVKQSIYHQYLKWVQ